VTAVAFRHLKPFGELRGTFSVGEFSTVIRSDFWQFSSFAGFAGMYGFGEFNTAPRREFKQPAVCLDNDCGPWVLFGACIELAGLDGQFLRGC